MQSNDVKNTCENIRKHIKRFFNNKVDDFCTKNLSTDATKAFNIDFFAYNNFTILFTYRDGDIECKIKFDENNFIKLKNTQKYYIEDNFDVFCKELQEQLELRITDKYLEAHGWK